MVDIFDEVSDDLRTERAARLLRRYGGLIIALMVAVVAGVAAEQGYAWYQGKRSNAAAAAYMTIAGPLDNPPGELGDPQRLDGARRLAAFANGAPAGYRTQARLRAAALYADVGQPAAAEALWDDVAGDGAADPLLRGLANLLWAQHALGTAPDAAVAARLTPLASADSPWHGLAQETQALLAMKQGKLDQAKALFSQISSDPSDPEGVRNRADGLLAKLNG